MPKILIWDIETAPMRAYIWSIWKENIPPARLLDQWNVLTWSAKWLGSDEVMYDSLHLHDVDFSDAGGDIDRPILESLHTLLDEADITIAHNGNKFDMKKVNARFIKHKMKPPSPSRQIDTFVEAKKSFAFTSNRLDAIGEFLGVGGKAETGGFELWDRCCHGDPEAFKTMVDYNIRDIQLLEDVYLAMRPWMKNHPNLGVYSDEERPECPKCSSTNIHWRGNATTQAGKFHRFQCQDCGGWGKTRYTVLSKEKRKSLVTNAQ